MQALPLTLLALGLVLSCPSNRGQKIPSCIKEKIDAFSSAPPANPRRSITAYEYNGRTVYYITAPCCDQMNELFDANCNLLCCPDGGFTGKGDGRCPDFREMKSSPVVVWQDDR
jgi:hypothetical protein